MSRHIFVVLAFLTLPLAAQPEGSAVASRSVVEFKGRIEQTSIGRGQGMPYLEVRYGRDLWRVYLGAMHYLIAENFNPKAGQEIVVKGYRSEDTVVAIEVTLTAEKKTLRLRDGQGRPLWRGGPWRRGRRRQ